MLKINVPATNRIEYIQCLARTIFETHIQKELNANLTKTSVEVVPRTCQKVRDLYHNALKGESYRPKKSFENLDTVKRKILNGVPHVVESNGKLKSFHFESDAFGNDYNHAELIPACINNIIRHNKPHGKYLTVYGFKTDVSGLSFDEKMVLSTTVRLYVLESMLDYYAEYISDIAHMRLMLFMIERLDGYISKSFDPQLVEG